VLRLIFVCTGNICRSPMAEGLMRHRLAAEGQDASGITSMGTHGVVDAPASLPAQQVCQQHGVDISGHRARSLVGEEIQEADMILCMEPMHKQMVGAYFPWHRDRIYLLGAWPGKETRKSIVRDPMGQSMAVYQQVFADIQRHLDRICQML